MGITVTYVPDYCLQEVSDHAMALLLALARKIPLSNQLVQAGCTISDKVQQCVEGAQNHGQFVSCVAHLTNDLNKAGTITGKEKGAIQSCAAQTRIP